MSLVPSSSILISGLTVSSLLVAVSLAQNNIPFQLIDHKPLKSCLLKQSTISLTRDNLNFFETLGLATQVINRSTKCPGQIIIDNKQNLLGTIDYQTISGLEENRIISSVALQDLLLNRLAEQNIIPTTEKKIEKSFDYSISKHKTLLRNPKLPFDAQNRNTAISAPESDTPLSVRISRLVPGLSSLFDLPSVAKAKYDNSLDLDIQQHPDQVTIQFEDSEQKQFSFIIGGDDVDSKVREKVVSTDISRDSSFFTFNHMGYTTVPLPRLSTDEEKNFIQLSDSSINDSWFSKSEYTGRVVNAETFTSSEFSQDTPIQKKKKKKSLKKSKLARSRAQDVNENNPGTPVITRVGWPHKGKFLPKYIVPGNSCPGITIHLPESQTLHYQPISASTALYTFRLPIESPTATSLDPEGLMLAIKQWFAHESKVENQLPSPFLELINTTCMASPAFPILPLLPEVDVRHTYGTDGFNSVLIGTARINAVGGAPYSPETSLQIENAQLLSDLIAKNVSFEDSQFICMHPDIIREFYSSQQRKSMELHSRMFSYSSLTRDGLFPGYYKIRFLYSIIPSKWIGRWLSCVGILNNKPKKFKKMAVKF